MSHTPCSNNERDSRLDATTFFKRTALSAITGIGLLGLVACGGGGSGGKKTPVTPSSSSSSVSSSSSSSSSSVDNEGLTMLSTKDNKWVKASGNPVILKGTNLGNWLVQEYWMMGGGTADVYDQCTLEKKLTERFGYDEKERLIKLFRDNWITTRDWDNMQALGLNIVRLPILWNVIEDEKKPKTLRADAWYYLDMTIAEAKKRNMYVILDLHGALGGQTGADHTGCSGQNKYWTTPEYQDRTKWLWEQIATKYKDEPVVAAYDPLNEPWGAPGAATEMATRVVEIYDTIRKIDSKHIVLLPSFQDWNIDVYGNPADKKMTNVAFELHPYPGLFGDRPGDSAYDIHRDWLRCGQSGTGGVCSMNKKITALKTPLLMGEFQPWQGAGTELGGQIGRATYDTFASYNWAATSWSYKLVSPEGGTGAGTWGMVTNAENTSVDSGVGLVVKASTWDCAKWDTAFSGACAKKVTTIKVGGTGSKTYYFVIKTGANDGANPDVTYDNISIVNNSTKAEVITNGAFGSNTGWKEVNVSKDLKGVAADYNYTAGKLPVGGQGAVLRITRPAGVTGEINTGIYQAITLEGGQTYTLSGTFKDNGSTNTWAEMYLVDKEPVAGTDIVVSKNTIDYATASLADIENHFKNFGTQPLEVHPGLAKWMVSPTKPDIFNLPAAPTGLKLAENAADNTLTWVASTSTGVTGYKVYRSSNGGATFTLIGDNVSGVTYVDNKIEKDATYFYAVAAYTANDIGYRSATVNTALTYVPVPAKIEAEAFTGMSGIQLEDCSDTGGGKDVGYFDPEDYIEFKIDVAADGNYTIDYRIATANGSTGFDVTVDGTKIDGLSSIEKTGGWQNFVDLSSGKTFPLTKGKHTLRFTSVGKEWNLNWFEIKAAK